MGHQQPTYDAVAKGKHQCFYFLRKQRKFGKPTNAPKKGSYPDASHLGLPKIIRNC